MYNFNSIDVGIAALDIVNNSSVFSKFWVLNYSYGFWWLLCLFFKLFIKLFETTCRIKI